MDGTSRTDTPDALAIRARAERVPLPATHLLVRRGRGKRSRVLLCPTASESSIARWISASSSIRRIFPLRTPIRIAPRPSCCNGSLDLTFNSLASAALSKLDEQKGRSQPTDVLLQQGSGGRAASLVHKPANRHGGVEHHLYGLNPSYQRQLAVSSPCGARGASVIARTASTLKAQLLQTILHSMTYRIERTSSSSETPRSRGRRLQRAHDTLLDVGHSKLRHRPLPHSVRAFSLLLALSSGTATPSDPTHPAPPSRTLHSAG